MSRILIAILVAFGFGFVGSPTLTQAQTDVDCPEIATDADAQRILAAFPGDPFGLDADNDGNACDAGVGGGTVTFENFVGTQPTTDSSGEAAPSTANQTALPDTGAGVMAATSSLDLVAFFAMLGLLCAGLAMRRSVRA